MFDSAVSFWAHIFAGAGLSSAVIGFVYFFLFKEVRRTSSAFFVGGCVLFFIGFSMAPDQPSGVYMRVGNMEVK